MQDGVFIKNVFCSHDTFYMFDAARGVVIIKARKKSCQILLKTLHKSYQKLLKIVTKKLKKLHKSFQKLLKINTKILKELQKRYETGETYKK